MWKKEELDIEIMKESQSLFKDMEWRIYAMATQHDNNFLTLIWFLIATSWIIIGLDNVEHNVKTLLVRSIICFVLWIFLGNNLNAVQTMKMKKSLVSTMKIPELDDEEKIKKVWKEAENHLKLNKKDIVFGSIATLLQNAGLVLFIIWLIKFL